MIVRKFSFTAIFVLTALLFAAGTAAAQTGFKGKVRDTNGKAIPNATVTVRQDGKNLSSDTTDAKGNFEITGLSTGEYNLVFEADGFGAGLLSNVEARTGKVRDLGDDLILRVDPGTLIFVRGSVFSAEGFILPGAKVELFIVEKDGKQKKIGSSYSNSSGEFGFRHAEGPTKMRVVATYKGRKGTKDIEIDVAAVYRTAVSIDLSKEKD